MPSQHMMIRFGDGLSLGSDSANIAANSAGVNMLRILNLVRISDLGFNDHLKMNEVLLEQLCFLQSYM